MMTDFIFVILFGLNFALCPCEGNILLPNGGSEISVLSGATVTIAWKIDPTIPVSDLKVREWEFTVGDVGLAEIINDQNVTIKPGNIFSASIYVIKPSTLVLRNVDKRFSGKYRFEIRIGASLQLYTSEVNVFVATTPLVSVNCSRLTTVNTSDDFTCECKGTGGIPPANVTWNKDGEQIGLPGKEVKTLDLNNVNKTTSGKYTCEAKSHKIASNETEIELIVNHPPDNLVFMLTKIGNNAVYMECSAEARPLASFKIFLNGTKEVASGKELTIPNVNSSHVGNYTCFAWNILGGGEMSAPKYLFLEGPMTPTPATLTISTPTASPIISSPTSSGTGNTTSITSNGTGNTTSITSNGTDKASSYTEWYIIVVTLVSGIIFGTLLSYIVYCCRRRFRNRKPQSNPKAQTSQADTTYQELDLTKMNTEDNYQSLKVNAESNDVANDDDSTYTELNKIRDVENNYQSLT